MNLRILLISLILVFLSSACNVTREQFGSYDDSKYATTTLKKGKDLYLFWDKLPMSRIEKGIKADNYEKISRKGVFDVAIYVGTLGIFSFHTVKIKVPEDKHHWKDGR